MTPQAHLCRLLLDSFEPDEFRRLLASRQEYQAILDELPGGLASPAAFFHEAVRLLDRSRLVDHAFFELLRAERPRRSSEIDEVERCWSSGAGQAQAAPASRLVERLPAIASLAVFPIAFAIAWRRPNHALMFVGLYLCIVAPWGLRDRMVLVAALVFGSVLLVGGVALEAIKSRRCEPQPA